MKTKLNVEKENMRRFQSTDKKKMFYDYNDYKGLINGGFEFGGLGPNFNEDWMRRFFNKKSKIR